MFWAIEAISKEDFAALSPNKREVYILERTHLEDLWIISRVRNIREEKPFFFIEQLQNPYTGVVFETQIFTDDLNRPSSLVVQDYFILGISGAQYLKETYLAKIAAEALTKVEKNPFSK